MRPDDSIQTRVRSEVASAIRAGGLIAAGNRVVVAVSGGLDSVVLLDVLEQLACENIAAWTLVVAHLDHGLRDESADDARFVAELADRRGLDCVVERRDVAAVAGEKGLGVEEAARHERLAFLREVARSHGCQAVALAHHADDQVETALFRLFRGAHLRGLAGMRASRAMGEGVRLIRPMLGLRREQLLAYGRLGGLEWREDITNRDTTITRNYIRHELLPQLRRRLNPRVDEAVLRIVHAAGEAGGVLEQLADGLAEGCGDGSVSLKRTTLREAGSAVARQAVRVALGRVSAPMDRLGAEWVDRLMELADAGRGVCDLPGDLRAWIEGDALMIGPTRQAWREVEPFETPLPIGRRVSLPGGLEARTWLESVEAGGAEKCIRRARELPRGSELLDAGAVVGELTVRTRRQGDRIEPLGLSGSQSVSELLSGAGVPRRLRGGVLCVCDEQGIVYVWPVRLAARVALGPQMRRCLGVTIGPVDRW
ncbi:MAG: tRNA lysidine(34) synthetase TilS [Phycisphaerae bacterium]